MNTHDYDYKRALNLSKKIIHRNPELLIPLMLEETGCSNVKELLAFIESVQHCISKR